MNEDLSKSEQRRRQMYPLTTGDHSIADYAFLKIVEGKTDREIASAWSMRSLRGWRDLSDDVCSMWEKAGHPYGQPEPPTDFSKPLNPEDHAAWLLYREARAQAIPHWLRSLVAKGEPLNHCGTCTCHRPWAAGDPAAPDITGA